MKLHLLTVPKDILILVFCNPSSHKLMDLAFHGYGGHIKALLYLGSARLNTSDLKTRGSFNPQDRYNVVKICAILRLYSNYCNGPGQ
jgi:hypothetical protein